MSKIKRFRNKFFVDNLEKGSVIVLLIFAIGLYIVVRKFGQEWMDISSNFMTEMLGVVVMVFAVDFLIERRKTQRVKRINRMVASKIKALIIRIGFEGLLEICDFKKMDRPAFIRGTYIGSERITTEQKICELFNSHREKIVSFIGEKFSNFSEDNGHIISMIGTTFASLSSCLRELLEQVKPYPDPDLLDKAFGFTLSKSALNFYHSFPKLYLKGEFEPDEKKEIIIDKINPYLRTYFDDTIKNMVNIDFDVMLKIKEIAEKGELSYDIS